MTRSTDTHRDGSTVNTLAAMVAGCITVWHARHMMYNFLYLANRGVDVVRTDAVPYIWKEIGTSCRNLPQVHTIVRMMRLIGEIVCPSYSCPGM